VFRAAVRSAVRQVVIREACAVYNFAILRARPNEWINDSLTRQSARVSQIAAGELARQRLLLRYYFLVFDLKNCSRGSAQLLRVSFKVKV
jgi:hypothetical protein